MKYVNDIYCFSTQNDMHYLIKYLFYDMFCDMRTLMIPAVYANMQSTSETFHLSNFKISNEMKRSKYLQNRNNI